ncbi:MAG: hypothetical protein HY983_00160 [Candidatus Magasanikbacteria bacterium]|nr:hypothetical protein [Candidatus Magasanikbacteria bacterium]
MVTDFEKETGGGGAEILSEQRRQLRLLADQAVAKIIGHWKRKKEVGLNGVVGAAKNLVEEIRQKARELDLQNEADGELIRACRDLVPAGLASEADAAEIEAVLRTATRVRGGTKLSAL